MKTRSWRGILLVLVLLLSAPLASAQSRTAEGAQENVESASPTPPPETPEQFECTQPLGACFPDLLPTNLNHNATDERFTTSLCADFVNVGSAPTASAFRVILYVDEVATFEWTFEGPYQQGAGEHAICKHDLHLARGRHTFLFHVDALDTVVESNETNNRRGSSLIVEGEPQLDLEFTSLQVLPKIGKPNTNQHFIANVTNVGRAPSVPSYVAMMDENGPLALLPIKALAPGESTTVVHVTRTDLRPVGQFVVRARVDPGGNVSEIRETNNDALADYEVLDHPAPDLVLTNVSVVGNLTAYRGIRLDVTLENLGDRTARDVLVRLFNHTNISAGNATRQYLGATSISNVQFFLHLPPGTHSLKIMADPSRRIVEKNELNNVYWLNLTIEDAPLVVDLPNLVVRRVFAMPDNPTTRDQLALGALVENIGTNRSNETTLNFTLGGKQLGTRPVPALPPGASYTAYVSSEPVTAGVYSLEAHVDAMGRIAEIDNADNVLAREFDVVEPDLPPEEPVEEPAPPPPTNQTPTPATPTPATPRPTPTPSEPTGPRIALADLSIETRASGEKVLGIISLSLRNPNIAPLGRVTVAFTVDGNPLKEVLVSRIPGAGTVSASSGEVELPAGEHKVRAEVRIVGSNEPALTREASYAQEATQGVPGFGAAALLLATLVVAFATRRRG